MAPKPPGKVALLAIHPRFARSIMQGKKKVEFRKSSFALEITHVVVYATAPVQKVLGYFKVSHIDQDSPDALWVRYGASAEMLREEFDGYFQSTNKGVAIGVGEVWCLDAPKRLESLRASLSPPRSFRYLNVDAFEAVREAADLVFGR